MDMSNEDLAFRVPVLQEWVKTSTRLPNEEEREGDLAGAYMVRDPQNDFPLLWFCQVSCDIEDTEDGAFADWQVIGPFYIDRKNGVQCKVKEIGPPLYWCQVVWDEVAKEPSNDGKGVLRGDRGATGRSKQTRSPYRTWGESVWD